MYKLNIIDKISFILCLIGCINWGLIGLLNLNLITLLTAGSIILQRGIYILVFLSSLNLISLIVRCKYFFNQK
ncbi:DUF378 domain-containing protein [Clostridium paraputrificum]|uniref:DUF378 domain-containing protein n=1 Tax=Clostridium TaxID=1485 RepID=UPI003D3500C7